MTILEEDNNVAKLSLVLTEFTAKAEALKPVSLAEAKHRPDWSLWEGGIREELTTLAMAGAWELVDPPTGTNIVGSKWMFRAKKDAAGNIVCHKVCLVAKDFCKSQESTTSIHTHQLPNWCPSELS